MMMMMRFSTAPVVDTLKEKVFVDLCTKVRDRNQLTFSWNLFFPPFLNQILWLFD